jgi:hypothetical protein
MKRLLIALTLIASLVGLSPAQPVSAHDFVTFNACYTFTHYTYPTSGNMKLWYHNYSTGGHVYGGRRPMYYAEWLLYCSL